MAVISPLFDSAARSLTFAPTSLASSTGFVAGYATNAFDQKDTAFTSGGQGCDIHIGGKFTTGTSPTANRGILLALYGSANDSTFSGGLSGSAGAATPTSLSALRILDVLLTTSTSNVVYDFGPYSVAEAFGGIIPVQFGLYVSHDTGVAANATGSNFACGFWAFRFQSV